MADKRMFSKSITNSDAFLTMPMSSQALYFHLNMAADDDGFVNSPRSVLKMLGASEDDMKLLIAKKFVIPFESGIVVIKHWRINNYLRSDRYNETKYLEEKSTLSVDKNGGYTQKLQQVEPVGIPMVYPVKNRIDKNRIDKSSNKAKKEVQISPALDEITAYAEIRGRKDLAKKFYDWYSTPDVDGKVWVDKDDKPIKNWKKKFQYWESTNPAPIKTAAQKEMPVVISENAVEMPEEVRRKMEALRERGIL